MAEVFALLLVLGTALGAAPIWGEVQRRLRLRLLPFGHDVTHDAMPADSGRMQD